MSEDRQRRGAMSSRSSRHPVTVRQLPVVRCQVCRRTLAHQPGAAGEVLTHHYQREHPELLAARQP